MTIQNIAASFLDSESIEEILPYGQGLINKTYLVKSHSGQLILQNINPDVFPEPEQIMENLKVLNDHVRLKPVQEVRLKFPEIMITKQQQLGINDRHSGYWRALGFIMNSETRENITTITDAEQAGFALGHFHQLLSDLPPENLHDTLPGFHITPLYLQHYDEVLNSIGSRQFSDDEQFCRETIECNRAQASVLELAITRKQLPLRIIHGDPKISNILFDKNNGKALSLIDLDTVKPGLVHYDIGDCLRSCCNPGGEESTQVTFDLEICEAILSAYLNQTRSFFTTCDYDFLYDAIHLIPFELGLRFFTDYLEGNRYFKSEYPQQNLQKSMNQFQLLASIERQKEALLNMIRQLRIG